MSASTTASQGADASQFWSDFWSTLYQFTHPFSSTFFDSFFESQTDGTPDGPTVPQIPPTQPGATKDSNAVHFRDEASFEKYWKRLQKDLHNPDGNPATLLEHAQVVWDDMKLAFTGFVSSVEWQQTWIQMVLALHIIIFLVIILLRNRPNALAAMLFSTLVLAALSEPLNGIGSRHWQLFADDNYFDSRGVFTSLVWATPLLGNAILAMLLLLRAVVQLMVKVKKAQLQENRNRKRK